MSVCLVCNFNITWDQIYNIYHTVWAYSHWKDANKTPTTPVTFVQAELLFLAGWGWELLANFCSNQCQIFLSKLISYEECRFDSNTNYTENGQRSSQEMGRARDCISADHTLLVPVSELLWRGIATVSHLEKGPVPLIVVAATRTLYVSPSAMSASRNRFNQFLAHVTHIQRKKEWVGGVQEIH